MLALHPAAQLNMIFSSLKKNQHGSCKNPLIPARLNTVHTILWYTLLDCTFHLALHLVHSILLHTLPYCQPYLRSPYSTVHTTLHPTRPPPLQFTPFYCLSHLAVHPTGLVTLFRPTDHPTLLFISLTVNPILLSWSPYLLSTLP